VPYSFLISFIVNQLWNISITFSPNPPIQTNQVLELFYKLARLSYPVELPGPANPIAGRIFRANFPQKRANL